MTLLEDVIRQAAILKAQADQDNRDDELLMNQSTWDRIMESLTDVEDRTWTPSVTIFGLDVSIVNALPDGVIHRRPRRREEDQ